MIALPPLFAGGVNVTEPDPFPRVAVPIVGAPGTVVGAPVALTCTEVSWGVRVVSVLSRVARYWRYRPLGLVIVVPLRGEKADQVAPLSEVRVANWMLVLVGVVAAGLRVNQARFVPASIAADTNVHGAVNGDICSQSTERWVPSACASLANGRI